MPNFWTAGKWRLAFLARGQSIYLDENDDENWRSWKSETTNNLHEVLPKDWICFYPLYIEKGWREELRNRLEYAMNSLSEDDYKMYRRSYGAKRWKDILSGKADTDD